MSRLLINSSMLIGTLVVPSIGYVYADIASRAVLQLLNTGQRHFRSAMRTSTRLSKCLGRLTKPDRRYAGEDFDVQGKVL
jgi:hypothetical protein